MQINMTTEYAFRTLICLYRKREGSVVRMEDIVAETKIPANYLQRVVSILRAAGLVETVRGQRGGCRLLPEGRDITVYDIFRLYEPQKLHKSLEHEGPYSSDQDANSPFCLLCEAFQEHMDEIMKNITVKELTRIDGDAAFDTLFADALSRSLEARWKRS